MSRILLFGRKFSPKRTWWQMLHQGMTVLVLVALCAGLLPQPAVTGLAGAAAPRWLESMIATVANLLPQAPTAFAQVPGPGGVDANLNFWLKADAGTSTTTDGAGVAQWDDQSGNANHVAQGTAANRPLYRSNSLNFNPAVDFDGGNDHLRRAAPNFGAIGNTQKEFFLIYRHTDPSWGFGFWMGPTTGSNTHDGKNNRVQSGPTSYAMQGSATASGNKSSRGRSEIDLDLRMPTIIGFHHGDGATLNQYVLEFNGDGGAPFDTVSGNNYAPNIVLSEVIVGAGRLDNGSLSGQVALDYGEIILYDRELSQAERDAVNTYLAIKYGITLDADTSSTATVDNFDYVDSQGTIIWAGRSDPTYATYHNNVAGLGQDNGSALDQRISRSSTPGGIVTMALDNDFTTPNNDSSRTSLGDGNFLLWGHNGLDATTWISTTAASGVPAGKNRLAREWIVQETGAVGPVNLQVNVDDPDLNLPDVMGTLYLLVDSDLDGEFGDESVQTMTAQGGGLYTISGINFVDGQRFTFATPNSGIRGFVFQDQDVDGTRDTNEAGIANVTVTATDADGVIASTLTAADGSYSFLPESGLSGSTRITFTLPADAIGSALTPTVFGQDSRTNVNFVYVGSGWTVVNNGFAPKDRPTSCSAPTVATSCYSSGPGAADAGLFSFDYSSGVSGFSNDANSQDMGAVWANAHSAGSGTLYSAAVLRRHMGLGPLADFNGVDSYTVDGVYVTTYGTSGSNFNPATPGFTLQGVNGIDLGAVRRTVDTNGTLDDDYELRVGNNVDLDAFAKVGTVGFGGAAVAPDGALWLVNLNERALIRVDTAGLPLDGSAAPSGNVTTAPITDPGCANGDYRPWALHFNNDRGYVGVVCSAESSGNRADLHAYILSFDPTDTGAGFTNEIDFSLSYGREKIYYVHHGGPAGPSANWLPWSATWQATTGFLGAYAQPQPILSDIGFTKNGDMILGFMDRFGHQTLQTNLEAKPLAQRPKARAGITAGDIAKVCTDGAGGWIMENSPGCPAFDTGGIRRTIGGGINGAKEFIFMDEAGMCINHLFYPEIYSGSFCMGPDGDEIVASVYGPGGEFTSLGNGNLRAQGFRTFSSETGKIQPWLTAQLPSALACAGGTSSNMGQLSCFCPPPPVEIGNRIWTDYDLDGEQDPGEPPLAGVTVELVSGGSVIASAITDARGEYYFSSFAGTSTANAKYNLAIPGSGVSVRIPNAVGGSQQAPLAGLLLAPADQGADDRLDADATLSGSDAVIPVVTDPGTIDHTYDFGFVPDDWDLALRKSVAVQYVTPGSDLNFTIDLFNQGGGPVDNIEIIDYVPANLSVNDANWSPTTLTGPGTVTRTLTAGNGLPDRGLWPGESVSIDINMVVAAGLADNTVIVNKAEIANMTARNGSAIVDKDSTPDSNDDETNVKDDVITEDGKAGGDEDDHDPAQVTVTTQTDIYDLALRKQLAAGQPRVVNEGDDVRFTIEVFNQGTTAAGNITLVDRYPTGFSLSPHEANWTDQGGATATYAWTGALMPGQSVSVDIILRAGATLGVVQNYAEIQSDDGDDVDSQPEGDESDNNGDALIDDVISDNGTVDEDDHDVAAVTVRRFDLALRKQLAAGQPSTTVKGADVTYLIEVFNQGNVTAYDIAVVDYLTDTLALSENDTSGWVLVDTHQLLKTIPGPLAPNTSEQLTITLRVSDTAALGQLDNYAEIVAASEIPAGPSTPDVDSTPDTVNGNEPLVDDEINDDGATDEDDHDIASVTIGRFDLALIKEYVSDTSLDGNSTDGVIGVGDQVRFRMTVTNQGDVPAYDIRVTDYNPEGIVADDSDPSYNMDNGWVTENMIVNHNVLPGPLNPGESTTVDIVLRSVGPNSLLYPAAGLIGVHTNWAEISAASNLPGGPTVVDEDSTPDEDQTNDAGGQPGSAADNAIDGDGSGAINGVDAATDEDDQDPAQITVANTFDLAILKYIVDEEGAPIYETPVIAPGETITYEYYIENQGTETALSLTLIEHVPAGLILTDTNWTPSYVIGPGTATRIHNGPWAAGAWFTDTVIFAAAPDIQLSGTYTNIIEIESATNGANLDDVDSDPDSNATNELFIKDNFVRDNFRLNPQIFDEDDHDIAQVQLTIEDWGDNPDAGAGRGVGDYGTLLTDNGPRHTVIAGLHMGALVDGESDGQPTAAATGDNNAGLDDEDGVNRADLVLVEGMNATIRVTATNTTTAPATLYGFVDFNANGVFTDTGEAVSVVVPTNSEDRVVTLDFGIVPTNGITETFARFRLSTNANLTAQGPAGDGEVEDYLVTFGKPPADLALRKSRTSAAVVAPGDDVTFAIDVINQGVVTVGRALVVDYIPSGFTLSANDANGWVGGPGGTVTNTLATTLTPSGTVDAQTTVNIILTADAAAAGIYTNTAEIAAIFDENDQALTDIDSTPDAINGNGNGETTALEDDQIDENGTVSGQDEDDHDPATVRVEPDAVGTLIVRKVVSGTLITNCAAITGADTDDPNPLNDNVDGCAALTQLSAAAAGQHFTFTNDITTTAGLITPTFALQPGEEIRFENVIVGSYTITESLPNGWTLAAATCSDGSSTVAGDTLAGIAVTNGATITCVFTNTLSTAQFGDRVFLEDDGDGLADTGVTTPIAGMVITATNGSETYTTTTDAAGYYSFTVPSGTYTVTYGTVPSTYGAVEPSTVVSGTSESGNTGSYQESGDPDANHGQNTTVTVAAGEANWQVDFAFTPLPAQFGDRVFLEDDGDGLANTGVTTPIAGMVITATNGSETYTTTTNVAGYYSFTVTADTYTVTYGTVPSSYGAVQPSTIVSGTSESGNAGSYQEAGDPDANHGQNTTVTVAGGEANWQVDFAFTPLPAQFGDRVLIEDDGDGLANTGVITPVVGMVITATNGSETYTTTTDAAGYYSFTVPSGTYTVTYGAVPSGYGEVVPSTVISNTESGNAGSYREPGDPDANHSQNTTVTLVGGEANWRVDFLFTPLPPNPLYSLGNRLWIDDGAGNPANRDNGVYDAGESPVAEGVVVELQTITGTVVATTTTDAAGYYRFDNLEAGDYRVHIPAEEFQRGGLLAAMRSSTGITDTFTTGENNLDHGDDDTADGVTSAIVTLGANNPIGDVDGGVVGAGANGATGDAYDNLTVDFGFVPPLAQFGDRVWLESDGDGYADSGDITPIAGMVITATNGTDVYTTTTNAAGYYSFTVPGDTYTVTYGTVPPSYGNVVPSTVVSGTSESGNAGSYAETGDPDANHSQNTVVTVAAGEANWQVDFAFQPVVPPVPNPGGFAIHKTIATTDGSSPSLSESFNVVVRCAGASGYPTTLSLNGDGTPVTAGNLISGTVCSFSEDTLTLPTAPSGYTWVNAVISPASITIQSDVTTTVTATNWLAPLPELPTSVLTVTKTISGAGSGPFDITITGPNQYSTTAQINGGELLTFSVPLGVYTITETSPGVGWVTVYTATTGYSTGSSAVVTLTNVSSAPLTAPGTISGNVFRDFDADGVDDGANEIGVAGVIVTAYDRNGVAQGTATTVAGGNYTLNTTGNGPYRLEFTNLPTGYAPTMRGTGNGTSTQFVSAPASNINFGVNHPGDYSQANPDMITSVYFNGDTNSTAPTGTLVKFAYNSSGASPTPTMLATKAQIGSTWGLAYARSTETIYAAAFLKRHVGLGPNGPGAIYAIDINGGTPTLFTDLATLGADVGTVLSNSARGLGEPTSPNNDPTTFDQVGKVGLGDMDISADERTLYAVSLNDKRLYVLNIPAGTLANSYAIPDPGCTGGDWRPFGLKYRLGSVYVGGVCDAATSQLASDLQAIVYKFDGTSFTNVLSFALDYPKGNTSYGACPGAGYAWHPWVATMPCNVSVLSYPEPILSDIEFDVDGSMILGFSDRFTHQTGNANYPPTGTTLMYSESSGDILRACYVGSSFVLQGNSGCPNKFANTQGPGGGEYYNDISGYDQHNAEGAQGGLALLPGRGEVATTGDDPISIRAGGVYWMNNNSGAKVRAYDVYSNPQNNAVNFAKGTGLGDLELLLDPAPIEIGNRVWNDGNGNGVQDPGEPGINGVQVSLQSPTGTVGTLTTSGDGNYTFNTLVPNTPYTITIDAAQIALSGLRLTVANTQAISGSTASNDAILDTRDSDAVLNGGVATIYYTTGGPGQNNHGLDFGFVQPADGQVDILNIAPTSLSAQFGDRVWIESDYDGLAATGVITPVAGMVITATNGSETYTTTTNAAGYYSFTVPADTYTVTYGTVPPSYGDVIPSTVVSGTSESGNAGSYAEAGNPDANHGQNTVVTVAAGEANWQVDFAFWLPQPAIEVEKYTNGDDADTPTGPTLAVGDLVTWTYVITNTGNVTLTEITLVDDMEGTVSCPATVLGPNESVTCLLTGTATAGLYANTAVVTGTPTITGTTPVTATDPSHYTGLVAGIGDRVWYDDNLNGIQDLGESGVPSVTVQLLDSGGTVLSTTATSAAGYYSFTNLAPGIYSIRFVSSTLPAGYLFTQQDANNNSNNATDSDADPATGQAINTLLVGNEYDPDWDAGIWLPQPSITVEKATNGEDADSEPGPSLTAAATVTWTYELTNTGNVTLTNVTLVDNVEGIVSCPVTELGPNVGTTCLLTGIAVAGQYSNTAIVTGTPTVGILTPVTDTDPSHYIVPLYSLGNRLWIDDGAGNLANRDNGLYDAGELPVAEGVVVELQTITGTVVATTTTDAAGYYRFDNLLAGDYRVHIPTEEFQPGGLLAAMRSSTGITDTFTTGENNLDHGDDDTSDGVTSAVITLGSNNPLGDVDGGVMGAGANGASGDANDNLTVDFGFVPPLAQFGDRVFLEDDGDGLADTSVTTPIAGMVITATNGSETYTTTTDVAGYYSFTVPSGTYTVTYGVVPSSYGEVVPSIVISNTESGNAGSYQEAGDPDANHAQNTTVTVAGGEANWHVDFAFTPLPAQFGDRVFLEDDGDGLADTGVTTPIAGMVITATNGSETYTTTTDVAGYYSFTVPSGTYTVTYGVVPSSYGEVVPSIVISNTESGNAGSYQEAGDPDANHAQNTTVTVAGGEANWQVDFAFTPLPAQFGDRVLIEDDGDGLANTGVITPVMGMVITATNGSATYTTTTNAAGYYSFTVPSGTYTVTYGAVPSGYGEVTPSTVISNTESGSAGSYREPGDPDANHSQSTTVTLVGGEANWRVDFLFTPLPPNPRYSLGNRLWIDDGAGNPANRDNGVYDAGEEPVAEGVIVELLNITGTVVATTTTDLAGYYRFDGLLAGDYRVRIPASEFQSGGRLGDMRSSTGITDTFTTGENNLDHGDDDTADGITSAVITLGASNPLGDVDGGVVGAGANGTTGDAYDNLTVDFGFVPPLAQFGDRVFLEDDGDGLADTGVTTPIAGMVISATNGSETYTTTTDVAGYYSFTVPADTYTVTYDTVPASYGAVEPSATPGGNSESGNAGSYQEIGNPDQSHENNTTVTVAAGEANWQVDFAFFTLNPTIDLVKYTNGYDADTPTGPYLAIGAVVTWTYDITNTGNVTLTDVTLVDDQEGSVSCPLDTLLPGQGMSCLLTGTATAGQYANRAVVTGTPSLGPVTVVTDTNPSHYFGVEPSIALRKYTNGYDADTLTGPYIATNDVLTWTYIITNTGNVTLTDLVLIDDIEGLVSCNTTTLAVGETTRCTVLGAAEVGQYANTAVVTGTPEIPTNPVPELPEFPVAPPPTTPVTDTNPSHYFGVEPSVALRKYTNGYDADVAPGPYIAVNTVVTWTYIITNTGNVTLTDLALIDDVEGDITCPVTVLAVGATTTCTWTGSALTGQYENTAVVTGTPEIPTNPVPELPEFPIIAPPTTPVTATNPSHYFGVEAGIGDRVWYDDDHDGVQDANEIGVPDITVELLDSNGDILRTTTTSSSGYYSFTGLTPAVYRIRFVTSTLPSGYLITQPNQGSDDSADSDANPTTGETSPTTLSADEFDPTWDMGIYRPTASVGDLVWEDLNHNGTQDPNEPGISGVTVTLTDRAGLTQTVTTDVNGNYTFTDLTPNEPYTVTFTTPDGYEPTVDNVGDDATDSDGEQVVVTLEPGEHDPTIDRGFWRPAAIGDRVWYDDDRNGVQDSGEIGVENVAVELLDSNGQVIDSTTTDASGWYSFTNLVTGDYRIRFVTSTLPDGYVLTTPDQGSDDATDSDANPTTGATVQTNLQPGEYDPTWDAGIYRPTASVGDLVWEDLNHNGTQDPNEPGIPGVTVTVTDRAGLTQTVTTDVNGNYAFTDLTPNEPYTVTFATPAGYEPTVDNVGDDATDSDGEQVVVTLEPGEHDPTIDRGFWRPAGIGDRVWYDDDRDGVQDPGETGVSGVTVELLDSNGQVIDSTTTDASGYYSFTGLVTGDYGIRFVNSTLPSGYVISPQDNNGDDATDSDANPTTGETSPTTLSADEFDPTWDMGIYRPTASVGDLVWEDLNHNGTQDPNEPGIPGVTVTVTDRAGLTQTVTTDANGNYTFTDLTPGEPYTVTFAPPTGYEPTVDNVGDDATDSDGEQVIVTLEPGEYNPTIDRGFWRPAGIGDRVWYDDDRDGVQDANETGVENVTVELLDSNGQVIDSTTTDSSGYYSFTGLVTGDYGIRFVTNTLPSGYVISPQDNSGDDATDSDADPTTGATVQTNLQPGEYDPTWDAGILLPTASVGDLVWEDLDHNGIQDPNEPGISGVTVTLTDRAGLTQTLTTDANGNYTFTDLTPNVPYTVTFATPAGYEPTVDNVGDDATDSDGEQVVVTLDPGEYNPTIDRGFWRPAAIGDRVWYDDDRDGVQDANETGVENVTVELLDSNGQVIDSTTTDSSGWYSFTGLVTGDYRIRFVTSTLPDGYVLTSPDQGSDDATDSDANPTTGETVLTNLQPGEYDPSWDAGILRPPVNLGNYVWLDGDRDGNQENNEPGVLGIIVTLDLADGTRLTTTTDATGHYTFTNLVPNQPVTVTFMLPNGYSPTTPNVGDDALDSDPDSSGVVLVNLGATDDYSIDAGLIVDPVVVGDRTFIDVNRDGVQDAGDQPLPGVVLHLTKANGAPATDIAGNSVADLTTDANGNYRFANLSPGEYTVSVVRVPTGYRPTTPHVGDPASDSSTDTATSSPATGTTAQPGGEDLTLDFGFVPVVNLGNLVWLDSNNNGQVDDGEPGIPHVTVQLFREGDDPTTATPVATDVTDENGTYLFASLEPGRYYVYIPTPPEEYPMSSTVTDNADNGEDNDDNGSQATPGAPVTSPLIELAVIGEPVNDGDGENGDQTVDFAFIPLLDLGNQVWHDANNNGQIDDDEVGIANVTVQLFRDGDDPTTATPLQTTVTDEHGTYLFKNLEPGIYFVYLPTPPRQYPVSAVPTDAHDNGEDNDDNGLQNQRGQPVRSPIIALNAGAEPTDDGDDANGDLTVDFGFFAPASLGDLVWFDLDEDGVQDAGETGKPGTLDERGVPNVLVTLYDAVTNSVVATTTTDTHGRYLFDELLPGSYVVEFELPAGYILTARDQGGNDVFDSDVNPTTLRTPVTVLESGEHDPTLDMGLYLPGATKPAAIGDHVWYDVDRDGVQDAEEQGVSGVIVTLYRSNGSMVAKTVTGVDGFYQFNSLPPGDYYVGFTPPAGYAISPQNVGDDDAVDSDVDPTTGRTVVTTLEPEEYDPSWDLGLTLTTPPASIGDTVWYDGDADGVQDPEETGVSGVLVTLYRTDGTVVAMTRTDADGHYAFINLPPGDYFLEFTPRPGYVSTLPDQRGDDAADSDVDPATRRTSVTTLEAGEHDMTWDYGLVIADIRSGNLGLPAEIGNRVWYDHDENGIQGDPAEEPGVPGITVKLYDSEGQLIALDVTDENGEYSFPNLVPDEYYIEFVLPDSYVITVEGTDPTSDIDSNVDPNTGRTPIELLEPGEINPTLDAGIYQLSTNLGDEDEPMPLKKLYLPLIRR